MVDQKNVLGNVIRLQVIDADQMQAFEVQANPNVEQPFGFRPILIRENML